MCKPAWAQSCIVALIITLGTVTSHGAKAEDAPWFGDVPFGTPVAEALKIVGDKGALKKLDNSEKTEAIEYKDVANGFDVRVLHHVRAGKVSHTVVAIDTPETISTPGCLSTFDTLLAQLRDRYGPTDGPIKTMVRIPIIGMSVREVTITRGVGQITLNGGAADKFCKVYVQYDRLPAAAEGRKSNNRL
jgi:hypothetical protein